MKSHSKPDYDKNYYEAGVETGISGYQNYRWMPELSLAMAHNLILNLNISPNSYVLDFGCAKGYLVKALHILGITNSMGVDISQYAVENCDAEVRNHIHKISSISDVSTTFLNLNNLDLVIFKDVLEHISIDLIPEYLSHFKSFSNRIFIAVPLGRDDFSNQFVIPAYHNDITHITIKSEEFWRDQVISAGWKISFCDYKFPGMKSNWTSLYTKGNLFLVGE